MQIKNQMVYLFEMWSKIKSLWKKIPKWMRIIIWIAPFAIAIYIIPIFHSSNKEVVDNHIHEEAFGFNKSNQVEQCRIKYCYNKKNCSKNDKYIKCVEQRVERAQGELEK